MTDPVALRCDCGQALAAVVNGQIVVEGDWRSVDATKAQRNGTLFRKIRDADRRTGMTFDLERVEWDELFGAFRVTRDALPTPDAGPDHYTRNWKRHDAGRRLRHEEQGPFTVRDGTVLACRCGAETVLTLASP